MPTYVFYKNDKKIPPGLSGRNFTDPFHRINAVICLAASPFEPPALCRRKSLVSGPELDSSPTGDSKPDEFEPAVIAILYP